MPPKNPEFRHRLTADQVEAADKAIAAGRTVDTKGLALANLLQTYDEPEEALEDLESGKTEFQTKKDDLDSTKASVGTLTAPQQAEYELLEKQIRGEEELEKAITTAYQRKHADDVFRYQTKDIPDLDADIKNLETRVKQLEADRKAKKTAAATGFAADPAYQKADERYKRVKAKLDQAKKIYDERTKPDKDQAKLEETQQREQQRQQEEKRIKDQRDELEKLDVQGLRNELTRLDELSTRLTDKLATRTTAGAGKDELDEIQREIDKTKERRTEADRILGIKLGEAGEEIDKGVAEEAEKSFVERATSQQLNEQVTARTAVVTGTRTEVETLRAELRNPALTPADRRDRQNQLYDLLVRLKREEKVLTLYQNELAQSNKKFRGMDSKGRADELVKLGQDMDMSAYNWRDIERRLFRGEYVNKEEMAAWCRLTVGEILQNRGVDWGELNTILAGRPELGLAIAAMVRNNDAAREFRRQNFPHNWDKMIDFVSKHPSWLLILLAAIAATGGAAAIAAGPILGGAAGVAAGGAGVFGVTRPRKYG